MTTDDAAARLIVIEIGLAQEAMVSASDLVAEKDWTYVALRLMDAEDRIANAKDAAKILLRAREIAGRHP